MTVCAVFSQTASSNVIATASKAKQAATKQDTICLSSGQVRKSIQTADSLAIMKQEVRLLYELTDAYEVRIRNQDSTISELWRMGDLFRDAATGFKAEAGNLKKQRDMQQLDTEFYKNMLRKQKRKTAFMGFATALGIAATIFLMK